MIRLRMLLLPVSLAAVAACASDESKGMKKVAGTYTLTSHDQLAASLLGGTTITLRADGRWVSTYPADSLLRRPPGSDSGTYRVRGDKVAIRHSQGFNTYVVRGDTLKQDNVEQERRIAQTEALTGMKIEGQVETFYVRVQ